MRKVSQRPILRIVEPAMSVAESVAEVGLGRSTPAYSQGANCDKLRVALISDHPLYRDGFAQALRTAQNMVLVEGVHPTDAVAIARERLADVIVVDVPGLPGASMDMVLALARDYPEVRIAVLGNSERINDARIAREAGFGYILKTVQGPHLVEIVKTIHGGGSYIDPEMAARAISLKSSRQHAKALRKFTRREEEILAILSRGMTNKEIGRVLNISEKTVKHHMTIIMQKLHVRNRVEVVVAARQDLTDGVSRAPPAHARVSRGPA
jgi:DNA-binding NarL/FixJ family response regulator